MWSLSLTLGSSLSKGTSCEMAASSWSDSGAGCRCCFSQASLSSIQARRRAQGTVYAAAGPSLGVWPPAPGVVIAVIISGLSDDG